MARKATELRPIMTRIPEALRKRLERAAVQNRRSMNAEIINRLYESFEAQSLRTLADIANDMDLVWARYGMRFLLLELQEDLIKALAREDMAAAAKLAKAFLLTRQSGPPDEAAQS
jgi:hypothetical protein